VLRYFPLSGLMFMFEIAFAVSYLHRIGILVGDKTCVFAGGWADEHEAALLDPKTDRTHSLANAVDTTVSFIGLILTIYSVRRTTSWSYFVPLLVLYIVCNSVQLFALWYSFSGVDVTVPISFLFCPYFTICSFLLDLFVGWNCTLGFIQMLVYFFKRFISCIPACERGI
jgi:hypothetical protein